ncbi:hypothetical protein [Paenibacillus alvei]|uniref:hypothetical protein n=1 Tax=Paenibacillus alvei TaxID=44250 RepID=UPI0022819266|nr:hypothetical protein [Paenibacillus alvei]
MVFMMQLLRRVDQDRDESLQRISGDRMTYYTMAFLLTVLVGCLALLYILARSQRKSIPDHISSDVYDFLERADDAYILTHESIEISYFSQYATSTLCNEILESIYKNPPKMFGTRKYRVRTWSVLTYEDQGVLLRKELTHIPIKVRRGIKVALGDDMVEFWKISFLSNGYRVEEVW